MTTQTVMKARIADELARDDLTSQIGYAISDAINRYQSERFWFNESRDVTFNTVASQEFYTSSDNANIPNLYAIDGVFVTVGGNIHELSYYSPNDMEQLSDNGTQTGEPYAYTYFQKKIRLFPVPTQVYSVRIRGHVKTAAPASDGETDNPWMTDAEPLIRARAKYELALHVIQDSGMASNLAAAVTEAFDFLKGRTNKQLGSGTFRPTQF